MDSPGAASNGSALSGGHCGAGATGIGGGGGGGGGGGATTTAQGDDGDDTPTGWNCSVHPSVFFLLGTLVLTSCSTAMLCAAIMTDHWEQVTWDRAHLRDLVEERNNKSLNLDYHQHHVPHSQLHIGRIQLDWYLEGAVARVSRSSIIKRTHINHLLNNMGATTLQEINDVEIDITKPELTPLAFLVPMHGGIWTLCNNLSENETIFLRKQGMSPVETCVNYLSGPPDGSKVEEPRADWQHRMQNLSISCALVCLIVLGSAALVGAFGVCKHQISAVLVTGVMYLLAASFALFTLTIIHFKRMRGSTVSHSGSMTAPPRGAHSDGTVDGVVFATNIEITTIGHDPSPTQEILRAILAAREFDTAWSLDLGWGGVMLTVMTSVLWILLSKIMRFNPISSMINY